MNEFISLIRPFIYEKADNKYYTATGASGSRPATSLQEFERLLAVTRIRPWEPAEPAQMPEIRIVIGVEYWSSYDMLLLDRLNEALGVAEFQNHRVEAFSYSDRISTPEDLERYVPGVSVPLIIASPVAGWWIRGQFLESTTRGRTLEKLAHQYGFPVPDWEVLTG